MRSPFMRITWLERFVPDLGSNTRPARTATPCGGGVRPSMPERLSGPASGRGGCAKAAAVASSTTRAFDMVISLLAARGPNVVIHQAFQLLERQRSRA